MRYAIQTRLLIKSNRQETTYPAAGEKQSRFGDDAAATNQSELRQTQTRRNYEPATPKSPRIPPPTKIPRTSPAASHRELGELGGGGGGEAPDEPARARTRRREGKGRSHLTYEDSAARIPRHGAPDLGRAASRACCRRARARRGEVTSSREREASAPSPTGGQRHEEGGRGGRGARRTGNSLAISSRRRGVVVLSICRR